MSNFNDIAAGVYLGDASITTEEYNLAALYARNSSLKWLKRSPEHYEYALTVGSSETSSLLLGTALHALILEPEANKVVCSPKFDRRKTADKDASEKFSKENEGKIILPEDVYESALKITKRVQDSSVAQSLLSPCKKEHSLFWKNSETQILCKARVDAIDVERGYILDLKTTSSGADPDNFETSITKYNYHQQAAFYCDGAKQVFGKDFDFIFLAVEVDPPFGFSLYRLNEASIEKGRQLYQSSLKILWEARTAAHFWGYPETIQDISIASWGF